MARQVMGNVRGLVSVAILVLRSRPDVAFDEESAAMRANAHRFTWREVRSGFCVRTFMKRPVKLPAQFETDIVKRLSLARRGGSPFYARSLLQLDDLSVNV
jgi:hypothetical protein